MGMRTVLDGRGDETVLTDKMLGNAYETVRHVARHIEYVKHLSAHMAEIYRVHGSIEGIDALVEYVDRIEDLRTHLDQILETAEDLSSIRAVANNIEVIKGLHARVLDILSIGSKLPQIDVVAASAAEITAIADALSSLIAVYNRLPEIQDLHANLATIASKANNSFTQVGSSISRTVELKLRDWKHLRDYGPVGTNDDTATWQAAFNALAASGGVLEVPAGYQNIVGNLVYDGAPLWIKGEGLGATILVHKSTNNNMFTFNSPDVTISDLKIWHPYLTSTAGTVFNFTEAKNILLARLYIDGGWDVVHFGGGGVYTRVTESTLVNFMNHGIVYLADYLGVAAVSDVSMTVPKENGGAGIISLGGDTLVLNNMNIQGCNFGIYLTPAVDTLMAHVFATNVLCDGVGRDGTGNAGWYFDGTKSGAYLGRIHLTNCWAGYNMAEGFYINGAHEVVLMNCISIMNRKHGIAINAGTDIRIIGCTATANSHMNSGTYSGIYVNSGVNGFTIRDCKSGQTHNVNNSQKYGIHVVGASHDRYIIQGNHLYGNVTGALQDEGTGTQKAVGSNLLA